MYLVNHFEHQVDLLRFVVIYVARDLRYELRKPFKTLLRARYLHLKRMAVGKN
jgi:hypothetical protein